MPNKGYKHTDEAREKIRKARAKQIMTPESNKKRSETQKGRKFSKESLRKMSLATIERFKDKRNHPNYGKTPSQEQREKMRRKLKGITLNQRFSPERTEEIRKKIRNARAKQVFPLVDSSIERKIQDFLDQLGIEYFTHKQMNIQHSYQCDIFIPSLNLIIETDGVHWHKYPIGNEIDIIRTQELLDKGFRVLRFWETEINAMELYDFVNKLEVMIQKWDN